MTSSHVIDIAREFSRYPGGRSRADGPHSGEEFLESLLKPRLLAAMRHGDKLIVLLDGVAGLPASFLDAAFGGLIRNRVVTADEAGRFIELQALTPRVQIYPKLIKEYMGIRKA
ncbi:STAS-like domain-containing protein [Bosea sp. NPDC003192]|uniref:STAS-like domain-containing protein n=1 Tax=Bosea sp. NPDC003192 TaxID=3390551 RepID=UPI003D044B1F